MHPPKTHGTQTGKVLRRLAIGTALSILPLPMLAEECYVPASPRCAPPPVSAPAQSAPRFAPVQAPAAAPATFAAPPLGGQVAGESNSVGIRGMELHFPEWRIALPTLQMPTLVRFRRNPEMMLQGGTAPMVTGPQAAFAQVPLQANPAPAQPAPAQKPPVSAPAGCAPAPATTYAPPLPGAPELGASDGTYQELEQARQQLAEMRQQLDRLVQATAALEQAQPVGNRRQAAGPVRVQSEEIDPVPQDVNDLPEPPPATTQRRTRGPSGTVVRSQSPVVPAGASDAVRPSPGDSRVARSAVAPAGAGAKKPVQRQGHAPYNPGSFGR